jgi:hypothetical protein
VSTPERTLAPLPVVDRVVMRLGRPRIERCTWPACGHVHARFPAPRHLTTPRCTGVVWWAGCVAWLASHCTCPGCSPLAMDGPGTGERCTCPDGSPEGLA